MKIEKGTTVSIHYDLLSEKGENVETTRDEEPVCYRHGDEQILPGLEKALDGHTTGDQIRVTLTAEEAYGEYNPEGILSLPRREIEEGEGEVKTGDWITVTVTDSESEGGEGGEDGEDGELDMRVVEVHDEEYILDANHPLAGQEVTFVVEVVAVEPAGAE